MYEEFTLKENIEFYLKYKRVRDGLAPDDIIRLMRLEHYSERMLRQYSSGMRQRVKLGLAILAETPLLFLDEPVSHQDVAQQLQVMQLLRELSTNHAVISSCHDINLARRFATHALVLGEGQHWLGLVGDTLVPEILRQAFGCEFVQQGDWLVPFQAHATGAR